MNAAVTAFVKKWWDEVGAIVLLALSLSGKLSYRYSCFLLIGCAVWFWWRILQDAPLRDARVWWKILPGVPLGLATALLMLAMKPDVPEPVKVASEDKDDIARRVLELQKGVGTPPNAAPNRGFEIVRVEVRPYEARRTALIDVYFRTSNGDMPHGEVSAAIVTYRPEVEWSQRVQAENEAWQAFERSRPSLKDMPFQMIVGGDPPHFTIGNLMLTDRDIANLLAGKAMLYFMGYVMSSSGTYRFCGFVQDSRGPVSLCHDFNGPVMSPANPPESPRSPTDKVAPTARPNVHIEQSGPGPNVAVGGDLNAPITINPTPGVPHVLWKQESFVSVWEDTKYAIALVLTTDQRLVSPRVAIECDAPFEISAPSGQVLQTTMDRRGGTIATFTLESPKLRPEAATVLVLRSKVPLKIVRVGVDP